MIADCEQLSHERVNPSYASSRKARGGQGLAAGSPRAVPAMRPMGVENLGPSIKKDLVPQETRGAGKQPAQAGQKE